VYHPCGAIKAGATAKGQAASGLVAGQKILVTGLAWMRRHYQWLQGIDNEENRKSQLLFYFYKHTRGWVFIDVNKVLKICQQAITGMYRRGCQCGLWHRNAELPQVFTFLVAKSNIIAYRMLNFGFCCNAKFFVVFDCSEAIMVPQ